MIIYTTTTVTDAGSIDTSLSRDDAALNADVATGNGISAADASGALAARLLRRAGLPPPELPLGPAAMSNPTPATPKP